MSKRTHTIKLRGTEGCIILYEDGRTEVRGPEIVDGDEVPVHIVLLLAIAEHLKDEEFCEDMLDYMKAASEGCTCETCKAQHSGLLN